MAIKVLILAGLVVVASAGYLGAPAPTVFVSPFLYALGHPPASNCSSPPDLPVVEDASRALTATETTKGVPTDPRIRAAYDTHRAFIDKLDVKPPYSYSYGLEFQDDKRKLTHSHYESRYGDLASGTATHIGPDGRRTVVFYTVDSVNGFSAVVHNDSRRHYTYMGYARLAARLSFASHPAPEVYTPHAIHYSNPNSTISKSGPLGIAAYKAHIGFLHHTMVEPPYKYSWGYELDEALTGRTMSQYESYYGDIGEGNFALAEPGGRLRTIDYTIDAEGFSVATPKAYPTNTIAVSYV